MWIKLIRFLQKLRINKLSIFKRLFLRKKGVFRSLGMLPGACGKIFFRSTILLLPVKHQPLLPAQMHEYVEFPKIEHQCVIQI